MRVMKRFWLWIALGTVSMFFGCGREPFEPPPEPAYGMTSPIQPAEPPPDSGYGRDWGAEYGVVFEPQDTDTNLEPFTDEPVDGLDVVEPEAE
jgi:hypothetical protein